MIEDNHDGTFEVACDYCSEDTEIDTDGDWNAMIQQLKEEGWFIRKMGNEWKHMCGDCHAAGKRW